MKKIGEYKFIAVILITFYSIAVILWQTTHTVFYLANFIFIGTAIALGMGLWPILPPDKKPIARIISQILVGGYMFFGLGMGLIYAFFGHLMPENMQIEGFWFWLLSGVFAASVLHYIIAKIIGPLVFGRGWCGWACWTTAVLDLLPWKKSPGRLPKVWEYIRYLNFLLSVSLVFIMVFVFKHNLFNNIGVVAFPKINIPPGLHRYATLWSIPELWWFIAGNLFYYLTGVILAVILKDNRAFCKYLCPVAVFLKLGSRLSWLKIKTNRNKCSNCSACERNCPMDIKITEYVHQNRRVTSSECILCQTCTKVCKQGALTVSTGFDIGVKDYLKRK